MEGIGEDFIPTNFDRQVIDEFVRVSDRESFQMARRLAREEGLLVGGSSATAVAAAVKYAQRLEPEKVIVVMLPDTGRNYINRFYSNRWMQENGFAGPVEEPVTVGAVLAEKKLLPAILSVSLDDTLGEHPGHEIAKKQMYGYSGMVSFEINGGRATVERFFSALKVFTLAESLGGVESLACHPATMTHASIPEDVREARGITQGLIRLSVGIEDIEDLLEDLDRALTVHI